MIPVVADADTLFGATTRGLLIHLDYQGPIRLHWSPLILQEMSRALIETGRKPDHASARQHEQLMRAALPGAEIPTRRVQAYLADVQQAMRSASRSSAQTLSCWRSSSKIPHRSHPPSPACAPRCARRRNLTSCWNDWRPMGQKLTAAALHDAWQLGAVRL